MEGKFILLVVLTIFLLTESITAGNEVHLIQKHQATRAPGCIAAGFTHCCAYGTCRVDLPDGGQCYCDRECFEYHYTSPNHNCCSDNPCAGYSFERLNYFVSEGDGFVEVCGNWYGRQGLTATFRLFTGSWSAIEGRDFIHIYEVLQLTSGERKCRNITILDNSIFDFNVKMFQVHLGPIPGPMEWQYARVYITDNDRGTLYRLQNTIARHSPCDGNLNYLAVEGDDPLEICVRISGSEGGTVEIKVISVDGTATAFQGYIASNQTLTFTTPERKCIRIEIVDDSEVEGNEEFWVYLTLPTDTGIEVLSRCGSVQITDNDAPTLEQSSFTVDEGDGSVQVCMHVGGEGLNITATVYTSGISTATRGSDYNFTVQRFTMNSGERRCASIEILDDAIVEQYTEYVRLQFWTNPYSATYRSTTIYIQDNDAPAFESSNYFVDEDAGAVQVCMRLGGEGLVDRVTLRTWDGTAKQGRDYSRTVQTFTVNSGERKCITIGILNDTITESTLEYFRVYLSSTEYPQSIYHQSRYATVYIQDNDGDDLVNIMEHQGHTGSGCIAAGFTRCCAFGTCRVNLPEGGHCYCDQECCTYAHHNCCSDNPCDVVTWERRYYSASESDDSVEVCLCSGQTQGIAHAYSTLYNTNSARDRLDEWLRITPGGRHCWNVTLLDDMIFDLGDRNTHEYLSLQTDFYTTSRSSASYSTVIIMDNERAPAGVSLLTTESELSRPQFCTETTYHVVEGERQAKLCVKLLGQGGDVNADLTLLDGTARAFLDYNSSNQSLLFRAGENCVDIEVVEDLEVERTEKFYTYLAIATATGAKVLHGCDLVHIHENDAPTLEQSSFTVDEGEGSVQVCMHFGGEAQITNATFTIYDRSALNGSDYVGATQTFVVNSGERRCITIEILDDSDVESRERLWVSLTAQPFYVQYGSCNIYITDNDAPTLEQTSFTVDEGDGSVQVCMRFGGEAQRTNATFTIRDWNALNGRDYIGATQTFLVNSGERRCITIEILDDSVVENLEWLRVELTAQSLPVTNRECFITITDNDVAVDCDPPCANGMCSAVGRCVCSAGWTGSSCTIDIDECQAGSHNCSAPAQCVNFEGGFRCSCSTGYTLSYITHADCTDIDECALANGGCAQVCSNTDGSFFCTCDEGFELDKDGQQCIGQQCLAIEDEPLDSNFPSISLSWPKSNITSTHSFPCPCLDYLGGDASQQKVTRRCGGNTTSGAKWEPMDFTQCNFTANFQQLCELLAGPVSPDQAAERLDNITSMEEIQVDVVSLAAVIIENLTAAAINDEKVRGKYLESIDNLIQADAGIIAESQDRTQSSTRLLDSLTNFSNNLVITNTTTATFTRRTFAIRTNDINTSSFQGETFSVNLGSVEETTAISSAIREEAIEITPGNVAYLNRTVSVQVPKSVFQELGLGCGQQRVSYAVFFRDTLFQSSDQNQSNLTVVSVIVAVTVNSTSVRNLSTPITVIFQASELANNATSIKCGRWDDRTNAVGGRGVWITESCYQNSTTSDSSHITRTTQTTQPLSPQDDSSEMETQTFTAHYSQPGHFGLLLDLTGRIVSPPTHVYGVVLQSFSYVGLVISLLCLIAFIITHLASRSLRKKEHEQILINLSFALMGLYLAFILGANTASIPALCGISAALLQYFLLVFFAWTTAEAFYLYRKLVKVLGVTQISRLVMKIGLIVWLVPLLIVVVCAAHGYKFYYQESKSGFCRSWGLPFYIGLIAPFVILYILNWIAFVLIMISVSRHSYKVTGSTTKQDTFTFVRENTMIAFSLAVLFGLGWGFGLAASSTPSEEASFVFQLLFTIFVGCQGVLIFILHGVRKDEVRNEWKKWIFTATSRAYEFHSGVSRSASTAPLSKHTQSQLSSTHDMQILSKSGRRPNEVSSETDFEAGIDVETGESRSETKNVESTGVSGQGTPRKPCLIQVDSIKIPGEHDMPKASETPPPQREIALQSVAETPENAIEDGSEDKKETEIIEGLPDASAPSKQHARRVSAPEHQVTDAASPESKQARKLHRS